MQFINLFSSDLWTSYNNSSSQENNSTVVAAGWLRSADKKSVAAGSRASYEQTETTCVLHLYLDSVQRIHLYIRQARALQNLIKSNSKISSSSSRIWICCWVDLDAKWNKMKTKNFKWMQICIANGINSIFRIFLFF